MWPGIQVPRHQVARYTHRIELLHQQSPNWRLIGLNGFAKEFEHKETPKDSLGTKASNLKLVIWN